MRETDHRLLAGDAATSPVLFGVARGLEDLFPPIEHPRFLDAEGDVADVDTDETNQSER